MRTVDEVLTELKAELGVKGVELALRMGVCKHAVWLWRQRGIPGARAVQIEIMTKGKIKAVDVLAAKPRNKKTPQVA